MLGKLILGLLVISVLEINNVITFSKLAHMEPNGIIYRKEGETVEITCTLIDSKNYSISDLEFTYRRNSPKISSEKTETITIGSYAKVFRILNPPMLECTVDCMVGGQGVERTAINIGSMPQKVINFKCRSHNWENLTCSFERPFNPISVNYNLYYRPGIDERDYEVPKHVCNLKPNFNRVFSCSIDFQSEPPYRQSYNYYFFRLVGTNSLGTLDEDFTIDNFNIVIPSKPESVNAANITSNSAVLNWKVSAIFENYPKQFVYMINYTNEHDNPSWILSGPFTEPKHERSSDYRMSHALTNLPYANTWYDCRVLLRVKDAEDTTDMWSNYGSHVFVTESRIPDRPPHTDIGSFSFTDSGHVFIYWKQLLKSEYNGPNLRYITVDANNTNLSSESELTYVRLEHTDTNKMGQPLNLRIYSKNKLGKSVNHSIVRIPAIQDRCYPPTKIRKVRQDNETYDLSWEAPVEEPKITSYTVFWCEPNNESPTDCKGSIDFKRVNSDVFSYRLKANNSMNFAISANSDTSSSGMIWAMCTVLPGNEINKLTSINTMKVESTFIDFKWNLQCIAESILTGYILEYCPIKDPKTEECKEPAKRHNITADAKEYRLENLKPYTTYSVRIQMLSDKKMGPWSEPQVNTTLEAAPTPPRNLRYQNLTESSVELTWDIPHEMNGKLNEYRISYNNKEIRIPKDEVTQQPYLLSGLKSFTEYDVVIRACTQQCSVASNAINFNTSISKPGDIAQPKVNNSKILYWKAPEVAGGRLEYYDVQVLYTNNGKQMHKIIPINGTKCHFTREFQAILSEEGQFDFTVRAVNVLQSPHFKMDYLKRSKRDIGIDRKDSLSESNLHKRHSKPEIDAAATGYKLNHNDDFTHKSSEPEVNTTPYTYYSVSSADLERIKICEEEDDQQFQNYLKADKWPTLFPGNFSVSFTLLQKVAGATSRGYLYMIVLLIIFTVAFVYGTFYSVKKIKKMKDIGVELPEGLEDIKEESKAKHLDSGITRDEIGRSIDYRAHNEQENDPLVRFRMESASASGSENNSHSEYNEGIDNSIEYEQNTDEDGLDHTNNKHKMIPPTPLIPMQQSEMREPGIIQNPTPPSPLLPMSSDARHFNDSYNNRPTNQFQPKPFIQPTAMPKFTANGYVTHDAIIAKPAVSSGYTPLSAIEARKWAPTSNPTHTDGTKTNTPIIKSTDLQGISGYVTHKQLSDFGQLMH